MSFGGGSYDFGLFSVRLSGCGIRQGSGIRQEFRRLEFRQPKAETLGEFRYEKRKPLSHLFSPPFLIAAIPILLRMLTMKIGRAIPVPNVVTWLNRASAIIVLWACPLVAYSQDAAPAPGAKDGANNPALNPFMEFFASPINLFLISAILFMFIVARPQQKQRKEQEQALSGLKKNDRVVTNSGVHGIVVQSNAEDGTVTLRIDENTQARMTVNRDTIARITPSDSKE